MGVAEDKGKASRAAREARLGAALRENLRKRKAQSRARSETGASEAGGSEAGGSEAGGSDSGESEPMDPSEKPKDRDS